MVTCIVCRRMIRDEETIEGGPKAVYCDCANPVPELRPLNSATSEKSGERSGSVQWGGVSGSWSLGASRLEQRSRQLGENEELRPLGQPTPPLPAWDRLETCPHCGASVRRSKMQSHLENRCTELAHDYAPAPLTSPASQAAASVAQPDSAKRSKTQKAGQAPSAGTTLAPPATFLPVDWGASANFTIVIHSRVTSAGAMVGLYTLREKSGPAAAGIIAVAPESSGEETECRALIAALADLAARSNINEQAPENTSLALYCRRAPLLQQLQGLHKPKSAALQPLIAQAREVLARFSAVEYTWKPSREIEKVFTAQS